MSIWTIIPLFPFPPPSFPPSCQIVYANSVLYGGGLGPPVSPLEVLETEKLRSITWALHAYMPDSTTLWFRRASLVSSTLNMLSHVVTGRIKCYLYVSIGRGQLESHTCALLNSALCVFLLC